MFLHTRGEQRFAYQLLLHGSYLQLQRCLSGGLSASVTATRSARSQVWLAI